jgi:hypothetical protein
MQTAGLVQLIAGGVRLADLETAIAPVSVRSFDLSFAVFCDLAQKEMDNGDRALSASIRSTTDINPMSCSA